MQALRHSLHTNIYRQSHRVPTSYQYLIRRNMSTPTRYSSPLSIVHWCMAAGILTCFATIEVKKRQPKGSALIGPLMHYHKSVGLLMLGFVSVRVGLRLFSKIPPPVAGPRWQQVGSRAGHAALYGLMIFMPLTGVTMGYFGGKGLPFFFTKIPGADPENQRKDVAKNAWKIHKKVGTVTELMVAIHVAGAGLHLLQGQNVLSRIRPHAAFLSLLGDEDDDEDEEDLFVNMPKDE
eukprot:98054_1